MFVRPAAIQFFGYRGSRTLLFQGIKVDYLHFHSYLTGLLQKLSVKVRHVSSKCPTQAACPRFQNPELLQQSKADIRQYGWTGHPTQSGSSW